MSNNTVNKFIMPNGDEIKIDGLYGKITNCLLEVPQRIKLELNNGVLTLKAGSQVIIPNGFEADGTTPKFDEVVIESDITTVGYLNYNIMIFYYSSKNIISVRIIDDCVSGSSTTKTDYYNFYNTSTNKLGAYGANSTLDDYLSLPICICKCNNGLITSIDQIFNGMGYIGSTVWLDKGVKGLISNGRNEDGSLNNVEWENDRVLTYTFASSISSSTITSPAYIRSLNRLDFMAIRPNEWVYYEDENYWYFRGNKSTDGWIPFANCWLKSGVISNFSPKLPFRAVDWSDKAEISGWGMPSSKYINLTLGASGTKYTAPANGWFYVRKVSGKVNTFLNAGKSATYISTTSSATGQELTVLYPCIKGENIYIDYNATGETKSFKFIYAQGEV